MASGAGKGQFFLGLWLLVDSMVGLKLGGLTSVSIWAAHTELSVLFCFKHRHKVGRRSERSGREYDQNTPQEGLKGFIKHTWFLKDHPLPVWAKTGFSGQLFHATPIS